MPTLGLTMEEGTITEWLKGEGEAVAKDEPLFVVETDKATNEVPSPASGVLQRIIVPAGGTAAVREPIAVIEEGAAGESGRAGGTLLERSGESGGVGISAQPLQP